MDIEAEIQVERLKAAFQQLPLAVAVTLVNATLMVVVLVAAAEPRRWIVTWLAVTVLAAVLRLVVLRAWRRAQPVTESYRPWAMASIWGAFAAGLLWGGGSVLLFPASQTYQLFWMFLIGGMCAGAAALHYAHLPTALGFIVPAGLPLAIRFATEGSQRHVAASAMIAVFLGALIVTGRRSSSYFGETLRLRLELAQRTRDLDAINARLRTEIAEHRLTEASLLHAQKMEAVGQLTGGIAHDFNNLLTVVLGSLALLRKRLPKADPAVIRLLDNAVQGAERGAGLTQRLLAFGRRQTLLPEVVALPALVDGMAELLRSTVGTSVRIATRFADDLPPVKVDANQLELALLNLAANARDAMPGGGELVIAATVDEVHRREEGGLAPGRYVVLSVADNGEGMDEVTLRQAVEPFFTTKGVGKGTGLGLSMVHGLAAQSGGQFLLHSRKGVGTVAELWLPLADTAEATSPAAERAETGTARPAHRRTVLLVDDDELVLASTAATLEDLGYRVIEATSGQQGLKLLEASMQVDIVVTDYAMPGMTGLQLAEELHRIRPRMAVLLATGYAELPGEEAAELPRLAKPFGQAALVQAIEACFALAS